MQVDHLQCLMVDWMEPAKVEVLLLPGAEHLPRIELLCCCLYEELHVLLYTSHIVYVYIACDLQHSNCRTLPTGASCTV